MREGGRQDENQTNNIHTKHKQETTNIDIKNKDTIEMKRGEREKSEHTKNARSIKVRIHETRVKRAGMVRVNTGKPHAHTRYYRGGS